MNPPFLNGLAVFAHKHALAQAHACRGGKCKGRGITHPWNGAKWSGKDERSEGLHKRSAEDCGKPLARARDGVPQEGLVTASCALRAPIYGALRGVPAGLGSRKTRPLLLAGRRLELGQRQSPYPATVYGIMQSRNDAP